MYSQSCLRFLKAESPNLERLHDALEKLSIQAHRAGAVLERVQQLFKQHDSVREEVDCNEMIKDVYKLAEIEAHIRHIVIALKQSKSLPPILCDPIQIQQVVLNLLRNGMESMRSTNFRNGNQIVLSTEKQGNGVKISVIDSGKGITNSAAKQLFQPFSSTKDTGMGLGLSISQSLVNAHNGELEYFNNAKTGATFYFTLPTSQ